MFAISFPKHSNYNDPHIADQTLAQQDFQSGDLDAYQEDSGERRAVEAKLHERVSYGNWH